LLFYLLAPWFCLREDPWTCLHAHTLPSGPVKCRQYPKVLLNRWLEPRGNHQKGIEAIERPRALNLQTSLQVALNSLLFKSSFQQSLCPGGKRTWELSSNALFPWKGSYLVDPASSHMLVSKIKPCMSKYNLFDGNFTRITVVILELIRA
jgi:hypothetical protein